MNKLFDVLLTYNTFDGAREVMLSDVNKINVGNRFITFVQYKGSFTQLIDSLVNYSIIPK